MKPYIKEFLFLKPFWLALPFIIFACFAFFQFASPDWIINLAKEDSFFEWLTFLCLFGAAVMYYLSFRKYKNFFLLLLALAMFFGAGEEISWGQRIFGFSTPESVKQVNTQGEFTIHNLEVFSGKQFDQHKRTGIENLLKISFLFKIFTFIFGMLLPLATYHIKTIARFTKKIRLPIPPFSIGIFFLINWLIIVTGTKYLLAAGGNNRQYSLLIFSATEIYEFIAALVLFLIGLYFYKMKLGDNMGKDVKHLILPQEMIQENLAAA
jgi:hypothetical protein